MLVTTSSPKFTAKSIGAGVREHICLKWNSSFVLDSSPKVAPYICLFLFLPIISNSKLRFEKYLDAEKKNKNVRVRGLGPRNQDINFEEKKEKARSVLIWERGGKNFVRDKVLHQNKAYLGSESWREHKIPFVFYSLGLIHMCERERYLDFFYQPPYMYILIT